MTMLLHLVTTWILLVNGSIHLSTAFSISLPISLSDRKTHPTKWRPSSLWQSAIVSSTNKRKSRNSLYYIDPRRSDATVSPSASASNSHIEWMQTISQNDQYEEALSEVLKAWKATDNNMTRSSLALLFVSPPWADELDKITAKAQELLGSQTQLITVVGGGIVGGGDEFENPTIHCMSFFGGILPADSSVNIESFVNDADDYPESGNNGQKRKTISPHNSQSINSFLVFADPYSANVERILEECSCPSISQQDHSSHCASSIVAGAVTVASHMHQSTLAVGNQVLPPGSLIRARFSGNIGLQVVVSKGCRPVGPTYRVTKVSGPAVLELDRMRAIDQLQETIERDCNAKDKEYIQTKGMTKGVLGGMYREQDNIVDEQAVKGFMNEVAQDGATITEPEDFVVRQITGFLPRSGGIVVCGRPQAKPGDFFRFHVRSPSGALKDWSKILRRAKTERLFLGSRAGEPLGALQFSCAARGEALFEEKNVDLHHVHDLIRKTTEENKTSQSILNDSCKKVPLVAGFFANAEISAVGNSIRMGANPDSISSQQKSFVHGYATVVAVICDYSKRNAEQHEKSPFASTELNEIEAIGIMNSNSSEVWA